MPIRDRIRGKLSNFEQVDIYTLTSNCFDQQIDNLLVKIAKSAKFILNSDLTNYSLEIVLEKYLFALKEKNYLSDSGRINRVRLNNDFLDFFGQHLLDRLYSGLNGTQNWLKDIVLNHKVITHLQPIKHILLILFLSDNIDSFFSDKPDKPIQKQYSFIPKSSINNDELKSQYFGHGPWKCLNPIADHYKDTVVTDCKLTFNRKKNAYSGLFTCNCGFSYYLPASEDKNLRTNEKKRVKDFGHVWEAKLIDYVANQGQVSPHILANMMGCDHRTILVQARRLGLNEYFHINNTYKKVLDVNIPKTQEEMIMYHREIIIQYMLNNPNLRRTDIRKSHSTSFNYLYTNDRAWFEENMPNPIPRSIRNQSITPKTDWHEVDIQICELLKKAYIELINADKVVRFSFTRLSDIIGKRYIISENMYRLPITKKFLDNVIETREQYLLRKVDIIFERLCKEGTTIDKWTLISRCGIGRNISTNVLNKIEYLINKHREKQV